MSKRSPAHDPAESHLSFRSESDVSAALKPLRLRSPQPSPLNVFHRLQSPHSTPAALSSSPSSVRRSEETPSAVAQPDSRRSSEERETTTTGGTPENRNYTDSGGIRRKDEDVEDISAHQQRLYRPEVRSCGHPQPIYLRVPVGQRASSTLPQSPHGMEKNAVNEVLSSTPHDVGERTPPPPPQQTLTTADLTPLNGKTPATVAVSSIPTSLLTKSNAAAAVADALTLGWTHRTFPYAVESSGDSTATESLAGVPLHTAAVQPLPPTLPSPSFGIDNTHEERDSNDNNDCEGRPPVATMQNDNDEEGEVVVSEVQSSSQLQASAVARRFQCLRVSSSSCSSSSTLSEGNRDANINAAASECGHSSTQQQLPQEQQQQQHRSSVSTAVGPNSCSLRGEAASSDAEKTHNKTAALISAYEQADAAASDEPASHSNSHGLHTSPMDVVIDTKGEKGGINDAAAVVVGEGPIRVPFNVPLSTARFPLHNSPSTMEAAVEPLPYAQPQQQETPSNNAVDLVDVEELSDRELIDAEEEVDVEEIRGVEEVNDEAHVTPEEGNESETETAEPMTASAAATAAVYASTIDALHHITSQSTGGLSHVSLPSSNVFPVSHSSGRMAAYQNVVDIVTLASSANRGTGSPIYALDVQSVSPVEHTGGVESVYTIQHCLPDDGVAGVARDPLTMFVSDSVRQRGTPLNTANTTRQSTEDGLRMTLHTTDAETTSISPFEDDGRPPMLTIRHSSETPPPSPAQRMPSATDFVERDALHDAEHGDVGRRDFTQDLGKEEVVEDNEQDDKKGGEEALVDMAATSIAACAAATIPNLFSEEVEDGSDGGLATQPVTQEPTALDDKGKLLKKEVQKSSYPTESLLVHTTVEALPSPPPLASTAQRVPSRTSTSTSSSSASTFGVPHVVSERCSAQEHIENGHRRHWPTQEIENGKGVESAVEVPASDASDVPTVEDLFGVVPPQSQPWRCNVSGDVDDRMNNEDDSRLFFAVTARKTPSCRFSPRPTNTATATSINYASSTDKNALDVMPHNAEPSAEEGVREAPLIPMSGAAQKRTPVVPSSWKPSPCEVVPSRRSHAARSVLEDVEELSEVEDVEEEKKVFAETMAETAAASVAHSVKPISIAQRQTESEEDAYVQKQRDLTTAADRAVVLHLEREDRRRVMSDMLEEREFIFREEAAVFAVLALMMRRSHSRKTKESHADEKRTPLLCAADILIQHQHQHPTSSKHSPLFPPSPPAPTSRQEVQELLRTRGIPGEPALGIVSAAVFTDELLHREVIEDDEERTRTLLGRLRQCEWDALWPSFLYVQESLAWQRIAEEAHVQRQRVCALDISVNEEIEDLLNIACELALCRRMEEEERREVIERAEKSGRQRLQELHWSGLAARQRQHALLRSTLDLAVASALDDLAFEESQTREELRVEAIRAWTAVLESPSGAAMRNQHRLHQHPLDLKRSKKAKLQLHRQEEEMEVAEEEVEGLEVLKSNNRRSGNDTIGHSVDQRKSQREAGFTQAGEERMKMRSSSAFSSSASSSSSSSSVFISVAPSLNEMGDRHDAAPHFFQWDPTSNSNPTPHASNSRPSQRQQHSEQQQPYPHSTSSPSPHLTNMTTLTTNTTTNTSATPSSSFVLGVPKNTTAVKQNMASVSATTESRRSPTLVLPTQQQLQQHDGIRPAEASALSHALSCAEQAVREEHQYVSSVHNTTATVPAEREVGKEEQMPSKRKKHHDRKHHHDDHRRHHPSQKINAENRKDAVITSSTSMRPDVQRARTSPSPTSRHCPLFITRHTIPCSLHHSPSQGYRVLVQKYSAPPASYPLGETTEPRGRHLMPPTAPACSRPLKAASTSPRRYDDHDVYLYDTKKARRNTPAARRQHSAGKMRFPWERSSLCGHRDGMDEVTGDETNFNQRAEDQPMDGAVVEHHPTAAASAESTIMCTPAREVFPTCHMNNADHASSTSPILSRSAKRARPLVAEYKPQQQQSPPMVIEVVTDSCVPPTPIPPSTRDVSLSPLSSPGNDERRPFAYAAPTAAWVAQVEQKQQDRLCAMLLANNDTSNRGSNAVEEDGVSMVAGGRSTGVQGDHYGNTAQCGCSRRRFQEPSGPLLITRLPFEMGPGVWPSALSERERFNPLKVSHSASPLSDNGGRGITASPYTPQRVETHVVTTTAPSNRRHCQTAVPTLDEAFAQAARTGEVVHLPTTVAEVLRGPQHTRLPTPPSSKAFYKSWKDRENVDGDSEEGERNGEEEREMSPPRRPGPPPTPLVKRHHSSQRGYNYVDIFYRQPRRATSPLRKERTPRSSATPITKKPSAAAVKAQQFIAERCAAVQVREAHHQLREVLRPRTTSSPSSPLRDSADAFFSDDAAATAMVDEAECFFDDGDVVLCSALASQVKRGRRTAHHTHHQQTRRGQQISPRRTTTSSSTAAAPRTSSLQATSRRAQPRNDDASPPTKPFRLSIPASYRVLQAPSPSYLRTETPFHARRMPNSLSPSLPPGRNHTLSAGAAGPSSRWYTAPTPPTPAASTSVMPNMRGSPYTSRGSYFHTSGLSPRARSSNTPAFTNGNGSGSGGSSRWHGAHAKAL